MKHVVLRSVVLLAIAASASSVQAYAEEQPNRRAGLWEVTRTAVDETNPARTTRVCIDHETEAALRDIGSGFARGTCSRAEIDRSANAITAETVCQLGGSRSTTRTIITITGDTAYRQVATTQFDPPLYGRSAISTEMDGKWIGACDADMRPGDMITAMGKINLVDRIAQQK